MRIEVPVVAAGAAAVLLGLERRCLLFEAGNFSGEFDNLEDWAVRLAITFWEVARLSMTTLESGAVAGAISALLACLAAHRRSGSPAPSFACLHSVWGG